MKRTWQWGASKSFPEAVKLATGKKLTSRPLITEMTQSPKKAIAQAKQRISATPKRRATKKPIDLKATITMVHGREKIANTTHGFEAMADKYGKWVLKQEQ